ncbi:NYN domain-containing protein [Patescibacteria group bacterium]|nr:NYN domain-containing protein [Patescibacteria group bacterium]
MRGRKSLIKIWRRFFPKKEEVRPEKTVILIDGENLHKSLKIDLGGLEINDFEEFKKRLLTEREELTGPPVYYTSVTSADKEKPRKILRLFARLADAGYEVKSKPLPKGKEPKSEIDPWVSDGIYRCAVDKNTSTIILVSGDHHFVPAVEFAKERGKKVKVVSTAASLSAELKNASDEWIDLEQVVTGITQKSRIEEKREQALEKLNRGKRITLSTFEESP